MISLLTFHPLKLKSLISGTPVIHLSDVRSVDVLLHQLSSFFSNQSIGPNKNLFAFVRKRTCGVVVTTLGFQVGRPGCRPWSDLYSRS